MVFNRGAVEMSRGAKYFKWLQNCLFKDKCDCFFVETARKRMKTECLSIVIYIVSFLQKKAAVITLTEVDHFYWGAANQVRVPRDQKGLKNTDLV